MASADNNEIKSPEVNGTGVEPNIAALLAYLFGFLGGLIFYLLEKKDRFVRFAAMQSIIFNITFFGLYYVLGFIFGTLTVSASGVVVILVNLANAVFWISFLIIWALLMLKAYNKEEWELPIIGPLARSVIK